MRIFYAAGASPNAYSISKSNLWKNNLFDSLVKLGYEVIPFSKDVMLHFTKYLNYKTDPEEKKAFEAYKNYLQEELLKEIKISQQKRLKN